MKIRLLFFFLIVIALAGCKKECYSCTVGGVNEPICQGDALYIPISKGWKVHDGATGEEYKCK